MANPNIKNYAAKGGRAKAGKKNKFPTALKEKVLHACATLEAQGKDLSTVALENPQWFYENFVKPMLPKEVSVDIAGNITVSLNMAPDD